MNFVQSSKFEKDDKGKIVDLKVNEKGIKLMFEKAGKNWILFITFIGAKQTGKTTKISMFSGSNKVKSETQGAVIYVPVSFNDIKSRFQYNTGKDKEDDISIFFIEVIKLKKKLGWKKKKFKRIIYRQAKSELQKKYFFITKSNSFI